MRVIDDLLGKFLQYVSKNYARGFGSSIPLILNNIHDRWFVGADEVSSSSTQHVAVAMLCTVAAVT
jgi:hypothetical protein